MTRLLRWIAARVHWYTYTAAQCERDMRRLTNAGYVPRGEAIARAVAILFGMEDHG